MGKQKTKKKIIFDPEGDGYDYETAIKYGITPDSTGHWQSRVPETGQILKGRNHKTYYKTVEGEKEAGYVIRKEKDGKYYSNKKPEVMKKTKKKRKMNSYAMGSGATGTIKNYMPNPNQVFREDQINADKAIYEASSNPWIMGMDALGNTMTQVGMSISGAGGGAPEEEVVEPNLLNRSSNVHTQKLIPLNDMGIEIKPWMEGYVKPKGTYAKGSGPMGAGMTNVNAESGEVIETPGGEVAELKGKKHSEGGEDIDVPKGTLIFSDQLAIDGKTMADRKKYRETKLKMLFNKLEKSPHDAVAKETLKRTQAAFEIEEQSDLELQGFAKNLDEMVAAMGTDPAGTYAKGTGKGGVYADGTGWQGVKDYFSGFTGGDALSIGGTLTSGISAMLNAKKNAAQNTPNENFYEGYADEALASIDTAGSKINGMHSQGKIDLELASNKAAQGVRNSARSNSSNMAGQLAVFTKANEAKGKMSIDFTKMMMENAYKKSALQAKSKQTIAQGETAADIANRMDADNASTQIGEAQQSVGEMFQMLGKNLNVNKKSVELDALSANLSKYGLQWNGKEFVQIS